MQQKYPVPSSEQGSPSNNIDFSIGSACWQLKAANVEWCNESPLICFFWISFHWRAVIPTRTTCRTARVSHSFKTLLQNFPKVIQPPDTGFWNRITCLLNATLLCCAELIYLRSSDQVGCFVDLFDFSQSRVIRSCELRLLKAFTKSIDRHIAVMLWIQTVEKIPFTEIRIQVDLC